ncbi:histidine phosphatase family protein [Shewanella sp. 125m-7]
MSYTHFSVLRHGLPEQADCLLGHTNVPLTEKGWQQMQSSIDALKFDLIISSPLLRCSAYARQLAQERHCELTLDDTWQELDFGRWDGKAIAELWQDNKPSYSQFWNAPFEHTPPDGESTLSLLQRVTSSIEKLSHTYSGKRLLIISHSGVMRIILAWLLNSGRQGNPHLSRIQLDHAALLHFNTYIDEADLLWPQLQGLHNPCAYQHSLLDK